MLAWSFKVIPLVIHISCYLKRTCPEAGGGVATAYEGVTSTGRGKEPGTRFDSSSLGGVILMICIQRETSLAAYCGVNTAFSLILKRKNGNI